MRDSILADLGDYSKVGLVFIRQFLYFIDFPLGESSVTVLVEGVECVY